MGDEAIELAEMAGLILDDWQQFVLRHSLGERPDGKWAAREIGLMVSRQNGKGALLEARELAGLFLLEEPMIIHSAHQFDTASEHFNRVCRRIEETPELHKRIAKRSGILKGHGNESIKLKVNRYGVEPRIVFRTRTGSGGLGFSISLLILDEAMIISEAMHQALIPTMSAQPDMQVWYTGSAVDEENPAHQGVPFARIREKGMKGSPGLAYFEWSLPNENPDTVGMTDEDTWALVNPGLGIRISSEYIREVELDSLSPRGFAVQRLGVGQWPRTDGLDGVVIPPELWAKCADPESKIKGPLCFSIDVTPDRSRTSICVGGVRADGLTHIEVVDHLQGTGWVVEKIADRIEDLVGVHKPLAVILDASGPGASLLPALEERKIELTIINAKEHSQACGMFYDAIMEDRLRHLGTGELAEAVRGAVKRDLGDAWAWSRRNSGVDISPLVGCTFAFWGIETRKKKKPKIVSLSQALAEQSANT